jgi:hypothetical protein
MRGALDGVGPGIVEHDVGALAAEFQVSFFKLLAPEAATISLPTSVEPVNATLSTSWWAARAAPRSRRSRVPRSPHRRGPERHGCPHLHFGRVRDACQYSSFYSQYAPVAALDTGIAGWQIKICTFFCHHRSIQKSRFRTGRDDSPFGISAFLSLPALTGRNSAHDYSGRPGVLPGWRRPGLRHRAADHYGDRPAAMMRGLGSVRGREGR